LCEEACPKAAIYLQKDRFAPPFLERSDVIWGKDRLVENINSRAKVGLDQ